MFDAGKPDLNAIVVLPNRSFLSFTLSTFLLEDVQDYFDKLPNLSIY